MSDITDNNNVVGIEHKNDILVGKSRISKSSGRLWISGVHKSLKRMSAPERDIPFTGSGKYHREPRPNTFTENGFVPHVDEGDDLDEIIEDLQDFHQSLHSSPRTDISSETKSLLSKPEPPRSGNLTLPRDSKFALSLPKAQLSDTEQKENHRTEVRSEEDNAEPVLLYCSHL